jgi:hypothetical protein
VFLCEARAPPFWHATSKTIFPRRAGGAEKNFFAGLPSQTQSIPQIARVSASASTSFPAARKKPL